MAAEVWAAMFDADRLRHWPSQERTRAEQERKERRRERAERLRRGRGRR